MRRICIRRLALAGITLALPWLVPGRTADAQFIPAPVPWLDRDDREDYYEDLRERREDYLDDLEDAYEDDARARRKFYRKHGYRVYRPVPLPAPVYAVPRTYIAPYPYPPVYSYPVTPYPAYGYPYGRGGVYIGGPFGGGINIRW